ncbi:MAG: hypothetical protein IKR04_03515 [Clostridia bacterium]|nr:hypothetical protein [Clostridia bacterium]
MSRTVARKIAFKIIFELAFQDEDIMELYDRYFESDEEQEEISQDDEKYIENILSRNFKQSFNYR